MEEPSAQVGMLGVSEMVSGWYMASVPPALVTKSHGIPGLAS